MLSDEGIYAHVRVKAIRTYKLHTYVHTSTHTHTTNTHMYIYVYITHTHQNRPMGVLGLNTGNLLLKLDLYLVINLNLKH